MPFIGNETPDYDTGTGGGRVRATNIFIGTVKGNKDEQRMGRLQVYIPELGGSAGDKDTWYTVSYASPFAGATPVSANKTGSDGEKMDGSQKSYGFWMVPPDLDNQVLVCFANGDTRRGFWFACLYQQFMNHMVPGVGLNISTDDEINKQNLPPVVEYNKKDDKNAADVWDPKRPVFEPLHQGLTDQGLYTDPERGPSTSSARREAPSKVFGFNTPRGHTIHIDEDPDNEFIRLRTRSGVQILMHETQGYIYMISKKGNSWFELSDDGINMYSKGPISVRSEKSHNVHAANANTHSEGAIHDRSANVTQHSEGQIRTTASAKIRTDGASKEDQSNPTG